MLKKQIQSLFRATFGLFCFATGAFGHGAEFKPEFVDSLIPGYLDVQSALASDNLAAAKTAATKLVGTAQHGPEFYAFTSPASALSNASDLKSARASFLTVSMEMQSLVDHVGTTGKHTLFEAYCPMAFGGKGGAWLQGDQNVLNPYYGAMMLRCGSIKGQVAGAPQTGSSSGGDLTQPGP